METRTDEEGVFTVYKNNELQAIVKRDDASKKQLVYLVREASSQEIAEMMAPKEVVM